MPVGNSIDIMPPSSLLWRTPSSRRLPATWSEYASSSMKAEKSSELELPELNRCLDEGSSPLVLRSESGELTEAITGPRGFSSRCRDEPDHLLLTKLARSILDQLQDAPDIMRMEVILMLSVASCGDEIGGSHGTKR